MYESNCFLNARSFVTDATTSGKRFQLLTTLHAKLFHLLRVLPDCFIKPGEPAEDETVLRAVLLIENVVFAFELVTVSLHHLLHYLNTRVYSFHIFYKLIHKCIALLSSN